MCTISLHCTSNFHTIRRQQLNQFLPISSIKLALYRRHRTCGHRSMQDLDHLQWQTKVDPILYRFRTHTLGFWGRCSFLSGMAYLWKHLPLLKLVLAEFRWQCLGLMVYHDGSLRIRLPHCPCGSWLPSQEDS